MKAKFKFILTYFLSWVAFFALLRIVFLLYHFDKSKMLPISTLLGTLTHGIRMDLAVAAYIVAPVCLFVLLSLVVRFFQRLPVYRVYTIVILLLVSLISVADLEIYTAWGFRIDRTPLQFLVTPSEALASVSHLPLVWIVVVFILAYLLFYFCFNYVLKRVFFQQQHRRKLATAAAILVFMGALIIPIRGGLQLAPLNQSSVYFSTNSFANHAAINASWNMLHSLFSRGHATKNPYEYYDLHTAQQIVDSLYDIPAGTNKLFAGSGRTNVIVLIWESFTEKAINVKHNGVEVTPNFNRLKSEGIFFENVFASGDRTNKGIPAILSGYPALPSTTIIHSPGKAGKLDVLSRQVKQHGYHSSFFYGGEPEFANIKSYLLHGGFDPIIGRNDFAKRDMNSKWGAHDGVVADRLLKYLGEAPQPFFCTWLTLSSHEPFETPIAPAIPGREKTDLYLNSINYTDQVIGQFINACRLQPWWENTVIVIVGDHGHYLPVTGSGSNNFRTPMLWLGGAVGDDSGGVISKPVSQLDIPALLAGPLGLDGRAYPFSKNAMDAKDPGWAFFDFNDGFGFADSLGVTLFDNVSRQVIEDKGRGGAERIRKGKAVMQVVYDDFLKK